MKVWLWCRFVGGLLLAWLAVHLVVLIDTVLDWKLTLVAGEYGHRLAVVGLFLVPLGLWSRSRLAYAGTALLVGSSWVLLLPLVQAWSISATLPTKLERAFPRDHLAPHKKSDTSFTGLWTGRKPVAKAPEAFAFHQDAGQSLKLYFYHAANSQPAPCLIVIHGGGWENGDALEFPEWNAHWSAQGFAVAAVEYRLAPAHRWPAPREDVQRALAWLKANAARLGVDPHRFVLLGRSAGGQIATACAYGLRDPDIVGCIALYAPHDMFFARRFAFEDDVLNSLRLLRNYLGGDPADASATYRSASGLFQVGARSCPTLLIHGTQDTLVWDMQSRRLGERLQDAGVSHLLIELPWAAHGFDWPFDGPSGQITRIATDHFLNAVSGR